MYLFLKVNGVTVEGDSLATSFGRQNSIEAPLDSWVLFTEKAAGVDRVGLKRMAEDTCTRKA